MALKLLQLMTGEDEFEAFSIRTVGDISVRAANVVA